MARRLLISALLAFAGILALDRASRAVAPVSPKPRAISYNRDIRPILSENCYACHGPDAHQRKAGLRLDQKDSVTHALKSGDFAVVPGNLEQSALVARITTDDPDDHMPPADSGKKLKPTQIDLLKRWIKQGAEFEGLWSFSPLKQPEIPDVKNEKWVRNSIDRFVLARLEQEGLSPSPEADRATLIRRLSFDLTGLPPPPAEVDAFIRDTSPDAYEKVVDRLLASPHYGERMALEWLDVARFADTHGYHIDSGRDMTAWRDWIINAYNQNMKFDRFTVDQIAGDLLPNSTTADKIASGFNRNAMVNFEGGAVPEEYLAAYQIDRVNTTGAVWLGLTVGCCQCHDHKFDPLTQKDFYQLYAFFNTIAEKGLDGSRGNAEPVLAVTTPSQQKQLKDLEARINSFEKQIDAPNAQWDAEQSLWEQHGSQPKLSKIDWQPCKVESAVSRGGAVFTPQKDGSLLASGENPDKDTYNFRLSQLAAPVTALKVEALTDDSLTAKGPGRSNNGNFVLTGVKVTNKKAKVEVKGLSADFSQDDFPAAGALGGKERGWAIFPQMGKPHELVIELSTPYEGATLDLQLEFRSKFAQHSMGRLRILATASADPRGGANPPAAILALLKTANRTDAQNAELRKWYRSNMVAETVKLAAEQQAARSELAALKAQIPTTMVMQEMVKPRDTFILIRGMYDKHGEKVTPNTPGSLPPMPVGAPKNRLGLAEWLTSPSQPLTARVAVNRYWQIYFGTGIVKTSEDFGMQGEFPSHPELLDWLATEFIRSGWNVKAMQKLIVTSAAYRQSSSASAELVERDPENRLLARGPRFRLEAEFIRDQALAISGLIDDQIGGKSVLPYQPAGLWEELMAREDGDNFTAQKYVQSHGKDLYRRGLYVFRKRTSPPPELTVLDAPDRQQCTVRRSRTNTPLQALELMNDPTFVEAARKLAEKAITEAGSSPEQRIDFIFKRATARDPKPAELGVLKNVLDQEQQIFQKDPAAAAKLLAIGESPRNESIDKTEHAAWTMLCSTVLNLDETVTKN